MKPKDMDVETPIQWERRQAEYPFLSTKLYNLIHGEKLTLRQLAEMGEEAWFRFPNVGHRTVDELKDLLVEVGLLDELSMEDGWKKRLIEGRKNAGLSRKQLADLVNVKELTIRRFEDPKHEGKGPPLETICLILNALDMTADWLLCGETSTKELSKSKAKMKTSDR